MSKVMKTMDGNTAAAYASYAFTDVAAIFPITPSSPMAELADEWAAHGQKNIFGQTVKVVEMQSEGGAAGAVHGSLQAGALTTTYTASQGLLLMVPNMYKIAGELLPAVFHVSARAIAGHALSIFGDHSDVMATRQTGFALLASSSVQEAMDIGGVAHLATLKTRVPFVHFFDGFRTSHEVQKIETIDYEDLAKLVDMDAVNEFRKRALNPEHPETRGTAQNPDIFFQAREASNKFYDEVPDAVADYMKEISKITGREYKPFNYYGAPDAENIIVAMGSVTETAEEVIDYLNAKGEKVGIVIVHLYRPFSSKYFFDVIPKTVKKIAVLDRCKEPGSVGEPLFLDVKSLYYGEKDQPIIVGGRYGLGSKDTTPAQIISVYNNLKTDEPKNDFTIGIVDDVTFKSLETPAVINTSAPGTVRCKFWGLGSDGTVGANKNAIKIIGDHTNMYAQGYFSYDSKKSGGVTVSHLRFGKSPIKSTYLIDEADFVSLSQQSYVDKYDVLTGLKKGGKFLLNTLWSPEELDVNLPAKMKKYMADNNIDFYTINATKIAQEIGLGNRTNMIMQSAFFKLAEVIPVEDAVKYSNDAIVKSYGKKGDAIVNMNKEAVQKGITELVKIEVPESWKNAKDETKVNSGLAVPFTEEEKPDFIKNVADVMNRQEGDKLPVSTFVGIEDGTFPAGTAAYEKRGIATTVPKWIPENCIQCNQCSFVCPHAVIRPTLLNEEEKANAPESFKTIKAMGKGLDGLEYRLQISTLDCTGCGNCADICPAKNKALVMTPIAEEVEEGIPNWKYAIEKVTIKDNLFDKVTVKGSQFCKPYFEFSGACAGCGETAYVKTITQLFGDRMMIANATGCSSIWGASAPATPYTKDANGRGPSWGNSLFEDNAEYGLGMATAVKQMRDSIQLSMEKLVNMNIPQELKDTFVQWIENKDLAEESKAASEKVLNALKEFKSCDECAKDINNIIDKKDFLVKKSQWIIGGDGWAYDIGYGGLDHVLASGEDVNVLVLDTEVYSNTGGQSSKATPTASVAKFAASGKKVKKKDLGMIASTYGYVYVAQVAIGADKNQYLKALKEAESYNGPSLIIAYAPCINHGIKVGMGKTVDREKKAVESGYWHLYRYNPALKEEGKNPFILDSKAPKTSFREFLDGEVRYASLKGSFPETAEELYAKAEADAKDRYEGYKRMAEMKY
ncbi:pyruvate:ferredoxin (flavodoxin) oxidoreductase [Sedimentibacter sp. MB31-C6]|uniref:pyruvate:ferredoxin (flavodoxin) oxidoreductase n=1 Tax=Sedimentibacter sp. MB31-C6 TaxID=3109366 RepID=UPI002DDDB01A|nr:pyruvate:ferredoxin (flavodoxin) oxidoreductase [Sedimentibacter sp. MB36-C1]WSI05284.1 pyruvate:ferredoxin (flavodoxin) oxidoreductase [Sedimentibacter sp. MB36-C1]